MTQLDGGRGEQEPGSKEPGTLQEVGEERAKSEIPKAVGTERNRYN